MAKTTLERYGVEHYNELPEMVDFIVKYKDGRMVVIEVKNDFSVNFPVNKIKEEVLKEYC